MSAMSVSMVDSLSLAAAGEYRVDDAILACSAKGNLLALQLPIAIRIIRSQCSDSGKVREKKRGGMK